MHCVLHQRHALLQLLPRAGGAATTAAAAAADTTAAIAAGLLGPAPERHGHMAIGGARD